LNEDEDRLLARIDARRAISALTPRHRKILRAYCRYGHTFAEIAKDIGVSVPTVTEHYHSALRRLQVSVAKQPTALLPADTPVQGFDKTAFLDHMRRLIIRRREERDAEFERDCADVVRLVSRETLNKLPPPPPPPPQKYGPAFSYATHHATYPPFKHQADKQNVEHWFDPTATLSVNDMREIALYAANIFVAVRRPATDGNWQLGAMVAHVVCTRDADTIAHAMNRLARELPVSARLSAKEMAVPDGILGASITGRYVAMRVASVENGHKVSIEVMWDEWNADG
jgi:DNA-binding CsgD family transcriptional regulator